MLTPTSVSVKCRYGKPFARFVPRFMSSTASSLRQTLHELLAQMGEGKIVEYSAAVREPPGDGDLTLFLHQLVKKPDTVEVEEKKRGGDATSSAKKKKKKSKKHKKDKSEDTEAAAVAAAMDDDTASMDQDFDFAVKRTPVAVKHTPVAAAGSSTDDEDTPFVAVTAHDCPSSILDDDDFRVRASPLPAFVPTRSSAAVGDRGSVGLVDDDAGAVTVSESDGECIPRRACKKAGVTPATAERSPAVVALAGDLTHSDTGTVSTAVANADADTEPLVADKPTASTATSSIVAAGTAATNDATAADSTAEGLEDCDSVVVTGVTKLPEVPPPSPSNNVEVRTPKTPKPGLLSLLKAPGSGEAKPQAKGTHSAVGEWLGKDTKAARPHPQKTYQHQTQRSQKKRKPQPPQVTKGMSPLSFAPVTDSAKARK